MSWKKIVLYYAVAVLLWGMLYRVEQARAPEQAQPAGSALPLVHTAASAIDTVVLSRGGRNVEIHRAAGGSWAVTRPRGLSVTNGLVEALLDTLTTIPPIEVLSEKMDQAAEFGLSPPRVEIRLGSSGRASNETLALGKRNPTRTAVYAQQVGQDRLYLMGLNAQYYVELIYEDLQRQLADSGGG